MVTKEEIELRKLMLRERRADLKELELEIRKEELEVKKQNYTLLMDYIERITKRGLFKLDPDDYK